MNKQFTFLSFLKARSLKLEASSGFAVLFAVLIGSLLFSLGLAIAHLSIKEIVLSTAGKESEHAFFAADTGIECALYWDIKSGGVFPTSNAQSNPAPINCNGGPNTVLVSASSDKAATSTFTLSLAPAGCAQVTVGKTTSGSTVIESRGRNDCEIRVNPARVERAIRVRY